MIPTDKHMKSAQASKTGGVWLRRLAPIAVLCGGLGAALFAGTRVSQNAAPAQEAQSEVAQEAPAETVAVAEKPLTREFQPSRYPGVMVRHVPSTGQSAGGQARWVVPRGGKRPVTATDSYNPPAPGSVQKETLPGGRGVSRRIPPSMRMMEEVKIVNGRVVAQHHNEGKGHVVPAGKTATR